MNAPVFVCAGCGARVPAPEAGGQVFRCPEARAGDDIDHLLRPVLDLDGGRFPAADDPNPFIRYRSLLASHALAVAGGSSDDEFVAMVRRLDAAVAVVDGRGFRETPFVSAAALDDRSGMFGGEVWIKDETGNVSGSHKARHLMGLLLHLEGGAASLQAGGDGPDTVSVPSLAVASCGNAALAAAVMARASGRLLQVFVPLLAPDPIVARLRELGVGIHTCDRKEGTTGDPSYLAFRNAVAAGAIPFSCQGTDNGLTIEGGSTLAWEMIHAYPPAAETPRTEPESGQPGEPGSPPDRHDRPAGPLDAVFIQVGGGALASGVIQGFVDARRLGVIDRLPRFFTVQTRGAYPLKRAYDLLADRILDRTPLVARRGFAPAGDRERANLMAANPALIDEELRYARTHRSAFMWPWEHEPHSVAHGITDDETYDWAAVVEGMLKTGGWPFVVGEERLVEANMLARDATGIDVDVTGSAGLAGLMKAVGVDPHLAGERVAVIFSGRSRD